MSLSDRFLDEGMEFWRPRANRELNREDVRQTAENLCGFFSVLRDWDAAERQRQEDQVTKSADD